MQTIQTVLGNINKSELGFCHSHEHIMLKKGPAYELDNQLCTEDYNKSLQELLLLKSVGGHSLVDAQPIGAGRMQNELTSLSKDSGINIVASTGFHKPFFYNKDHWIFTASEEEVEEVFVHELTKGMFTNTENSPPKDYINNKAGQIKVAYDIKGLTPHYTRLFKAAANASNKTNAPVMIHIDINADVNELDKFLNKLSLPPNKRLYCHLDRAVKDICIHIQLARNGSYLEYDTICRPKYHTDDIEIQIIKKIIQNGFEDKILLGLDTTSKRLKSYTNGNLGLDYIKRTFIPQLKNNNVSDEHIQMFMVNNPASAFSF